MSVEQNKAIVRRLFDEAWNKKNLATIDELSAPNYVGHGPSGEVLDLEQGKRVVVQFTAIPDYHVTIEDVIAEGDKVVVRRTDRFTHQTEFMGYPPTGKQVTMRAIHIFRLENGKIVESWGQVDMKGLYEQLGATLVPKAA